ncbi:MAG TPA: ribosome-associated translation inhibitor RaiA [Actinomycetota bacterium]|nr:ribosome-associated translation inhibitor RaiA [Actinomycetota bacterium]
MDLVVKARGGKVTQHARERIEHKLRKLSRLDSKIQRLEIEVIQESTPRVDGGHRVEAAAVTARRTFRATATAHDVEAAVERAADRLQRQVSEEHGRRRARLIGGAHRVKSADRAKGGATEPETPEA